MYYVGLGTIGWVVCGIACVALIVAWFRPEKKDAAECDTPEWKEEGRRRSERIVKEVNEDIDRIKADFEEKTGMKWGG